MTECDLKAVSVAGMVGPRISFGSSNGARPFVHFMGGVVRSVRKIGFFSHTSTNFAFMPGAGVDVPINDGVDFRVQVAFRRVMFGDDADSGSSLHTGGADYNEVRVGFGFMFGVGG